MSKLGPKCQYFVWPPLFSSTALTLLGMEFTRASQVATGVMAVVGSARVHGHLWLPVDMMTHCVSYWCECLFVYRILYLSW